MGDRTFLDTSILVYLFAADAPEKRDRVEEILRNGATDGSLVVSTQVMQEFHSVVTRRFRKTVSADDAERALRRMMEFQVVIMDPDRILAATRLARAENLNFWDALIVEAALHGGCSLLLTEDSGMYRDFGALRGENPFLSGA